MAIPPRVACIAALHRSRSIRRPAGVVGFAAAIWLLATPCFAATANVLYAGSLVNVMKHSLGPALEKATGQQFRGYSAGSKLLANQITARDERAGL